jgi:hypothetical protein
MATVNVCRTDRRDIMVSPPLGGARARASPLGGPQFCCLIRRISRALVGIPVMLSRATLRRGYSLLASPQRTGRPRRVLLQTQTGCYLPTIMLMRSPMARLHQSPVHLLTMLLGLFAQPAFAQVAPRDPAPKSEPFPAPNSPAQLTGKERLGRKWMDEQRIDNCNVPIDKRGTKPRSSSCHHVPTG